jgi:hypothetical protein
MIIKLKFFSLILLLSLVAISVNYYYGSLGVLPIDTFAHFDTGYRIMKGEIPFVDYWTISGPFIDFLQAFYFWIFGVSWKSYMLNSSILNLILTLMSFFFFKKIGLANGYSFFYSICVAILANPSMGTPFPDHYSTFFSLFAIISFIYGIQTENKIYWFLVPILFFIAFFCKQTPSAYIILVFLFNFSIYLYLKKNLYFLTPVIFGSIFSITLLMLFIWLFNVDLNQFLKQYFLYPQTIGASRFEEWELSFNKAVSTLKFLHLTILPLIFIFLKNLFFKKNYTHENVFFVNLNLILFSMFLIIHQWLTLNFIFIFFLIPFLCAIIQSNIEKLNVKKWLNFILILFCLLVTIKYHFRFNEERKMLDLENTDLSNYFETEKIDSKLKGLKWITRKHSFDQKTEINKILIFKKILQNENKKTMFISNYQFFSSILNKSLSSPNRWYGTPVAHPSELNPYYNEYLLFNYDKILKKKIEVIYVDISLGKYHLQLFEEIFKRLPADCADFNIIEDVLYRFDISSCHN